MPGEVDIDLKERGSALETAKRDPTHRPGRAVWDRELAEPSVATHVLHPRDRRGPVVLRARRKRAHHPSMPGMRAHREGVCDPDQQGGCRGRLARARVGRGGREGKSDRGGRSRARCLARRPYGPVRDPRRRGEGKAEGEHGGHACDQHGASKRDPLHASHIDPPAHLLKHRERRPCVGEAASACGNHQSVGGRGGTWSSTLVTWAAW